ncbi:MAG: Wzz/FepE/Etk N-terminal domain-containing protein [Steroidobacteraceae bacterium]
MNAPDTPSSLSDYLGVLRRRRVYLLTIIPAALLITVFLAYVLPPVYRASATILLESSSISEELVRTTVTNFADEQIEMMQRRVMTSDRLKDLVKEIDPYPDKSKLSASNKATQLISDTEIERVDPVTLEVLTVSNAFSIHYHNGDPQRAAKIAQRLADLFLDYNRQTRNQLASETYNFLLAQSKETERRIEELEQRIASFKSRYFDALPEVQTRNIAAAERVDRDLQNLEGQIRMAEERQELLKIQLSRMSPTLGGTAGNWRTELAMLQGQLAEARVRYTPDHPDVKRLQRQIEALAAKAGAEGDQPAVVPDNPDYLTVQSQLEGVEREVAALRTTAARARAQIARYETRLSTAPAVERDYAELTRSRDSLMAQYSELQGKLADANVARNLESEQMGARFTQIRTPRVPGQPYSPNRIGLILLGIVLGAALAVGLAALAESTDPSVRSARDLRELTAIPAIAAIPMISNEADRRRRQFLWASYAGVLLIMIVFVGLTVAIAD